MIRFAYFILALLIVASPATAKTFKETVPRNKTSAVVRHAVYDPGTCRGVEVPDMKVTQKPASGTITTQMVSFTLGKDTGSCEGKKVKGVIVLYRPNPNFKGEDAFKLDYSYFAYDGASMRTFRSNKYVITVK